MPLTRRQFLATSIALSAGGVSYPPACVAATSPVAKFDLGAATLYVVHDGIMDVPAAGAASDRPESDITAALAAANLPPARIRQPVNVTILKTASDIVVFDCGAGPNFMDGLGKLADNFAATTLDPAAVTKVVFTHGHPDHIWGAVDEFDDSLRFPNARYFMSDVELALWRSPDAAAKLPADRANFVPGARRIIQALGDRLSPFKSGSEVAPGILSIDTRGHTQGHTSFELQTATGPLVILGDALVHPVISFAHPDWRPAADHVPDDAVATRKKLLDRLVADKARILGYHLPSPGLGRVERAGTAYRFIPS